MRRSEGIVAKFKTAHEIAFSPDEGAIAYFGGRDVTALKLSTSEELFRVHPIAHPSHVDFSPDGRRLVVKSTSGRTIIVDATDGRLLKDFRNQKEGQGSSALFSACGQYVVSASWKGVLTVRDSATTELVFSHQPERMLSNLSAPHDRRFFVYSAVGLPPSDTEPTPPEVIYLHSWPLRGDNARELPRRWPFLCRLQISPSGRYLAVVYGAPPDTLEIYDIQTASVSARRAVRCGGTPCVVGWSPDESVVALSGDHMCHLFDMPSLAVRCEFALRYACFVRFSNSGRYFASGSWSTSFVVRSEAVEAFAATKRAKV